ncbi:MAG: asparagine synthase-related protein [Ekhidna sp.]
MKAKVEFRTEKYHLNISKEFIHDDLYEDNQLIVFVRGNGYWTSPAKWLNSKDIAILHQTANLKLDEIDGTFSIAIQDKKNGELKLFSDHLNFFPFYYKKLKGSFVISDSLASFKDEELNELGVTEMVALGSVLGEKTIFNGVNKFPGASITIIDNHGDLKFNQYWKCTTIPTSEKEFREVFSETLRLIPKLSSSASLTLTAGLDSRMVLSQLIKDDIEINTFTFGHPKSDDMKIASKIAENFEINHTAYKMHAQNDEFTHLLHTLLEENQQYTDGMINSLKSLHTNYCTRKEAEAHDMIITAGGELVYSHYAEVPTIKKKDNSSIKSIANFLIDFNIESKLISSDILREIKDDLTKILSRYNFDNNQLYYDAFYLEKLTSLTAYTLQIISAKTRVFNPIFAKKMIGHSLGLPARSRRKRNFQRRLIVENNSLMNKYLVNGFKVVIPTLKTYTIAKIAYAFRLCKKGINKIMKREVFMMSYIQYANFIDKNAALMELVKGDLSLEQLIDFKKNRLKRTNLNLKILNHWISKNHEDPEK